MKKYAVIDLGTNTFHLLIAETNGRGFRTVYRERIFVKLAENGIEEIGKTPFERGVLAIKHFAEVMDDFQVKQVQAIGTAALRTASNGEDFLQRIREEAGIEIELISGDREAALIHKGVSLVVPVEATETVLIMDIGGGSVEFIIANRQEILWEQSFPIGVAVLFKKFHQTDPISETEVSELFDFLEEHLQPLDDALAKFSITRLIGASGTFDVLEENLPKLADHPNYSILNLHNYSNFQKEIVDSTHAERLQMSNIPRERADLLVVAFLLIEFTLKKLSIDQVTVSHFAMKEGILAEMV